MKYHYYVIKRIILLFPIIFGVTFITFIIANETGDPLAAYVSAGASFLSSEELQALRVKLGLDKPPMERYFLYLDRLLNGDWGISRTENISKPVLVALAEKIPATAELAITAMILTLLLGIPLGIISAVRKGKKSDQISRLTALAGVSIPAFWMGLMIQITFSIINNSIDFVKLPFSFRYDTVYLSYQSITGFITIDSVVTGNFPLLFDHLLHLIAPAVTLSFAPIAIVSRMTRMAMVETMKEDYILLAKAKGLRERTIIYRHALKNAIIPTLTVSGIVFANLLTGSVLVETVFDWPGIGKWAVDAMFILDLPTIMGFTIFVTFLYVLLNLIVDLFYGYLDPRITL